MTTLQDLAAHHKLVLMKGRLRAKRHTPTHYENEMYFYLARTDTHQADCRRQLDTQTKTLQRLAEYFTGKKQA